ncbi:MULTISPECIES: Fur family transcriptional regulator [Bacteroides]|jgi:Fur family ferric uptake transcriptional regulator|uniref:Fur family transcriptional regulator n=1 Tax=Bacteroides TaxID=816 RepID=UPI000C76A406|nr:MULTISPECIES: transcriptional repressor [Bacteroides]RGM49099.1 transcriptional repressor [Bacteroides sp. OM08-11]
MEENIYLDLLEKREIQPTANRLLVLKAMMQASRSVSLLDLENILDTVDKSTIFRTITLFLSRHLIHSIDDGTGSLKYAVCGESCSCEVEDLHTHFHCKKCNKTFCFKNIPTPIVQMPKGFTLDSINYVLKGLCPECAAKNSNTFP